MTSCHEEHELEEPPSARGKSIVLPPRRSDASYDNSALQLSEEQSAATEQNISQSNNDDENLNSETNGQNNHQLDQQSSFFHPVIISSSKVSLLTYIVLLIPLLLLYFCCTSIMLNAFKLILCYKGTSNLSVILKHSVNWLPAAMFITAVVQSSSVVSSIMITLANDQKSDNATYGLDIDEIGFSLLGANIGTCITPILAIIIFQNQRNVGDLAKALTVALSHVLFNVFTVCLVLIIMLIVPLSLFMETPKQIEPSSSLKWTKWIEKEFIYIKDCQIYPNVGDDVMCTQKTDDQFGCHLFLLCPPSEKNWSLAYIFNNNQFGCSFIAAVFLILSLIMLLPCLWCIGKLYSRCVFNNVGSENENMSYKKQCQCIIVGAVLTQFIQSSSVFIILLVQNVRFGLLQPLSAYYLLIGSNISSTTTSIIVAYLSSKVTSSYQGFLVHFSINIIGLALWGTWRRLNLPFRYADALAIMLTKRGWLFLLLSVFCFFILFPIWLTFMLLGGKSTLSSLASVLLGGIIGYFVIKLYNKIKRPSNQNEVACDT